ncbi:MAG: hypothetical protein GXP53_01120 [Deltaproteobacteria bacterium]|nr:hypothetical protein [Deltaproteobacteria bacterium]
MLKKHNAWPFMAIALAVFIFAADAAAVSLHMAADTDTLKPGQDFFVEILADDPSGTTGAVFSIYYPKDALQADQSSVSSPFFESGSWQANFDEPGVVYFAGLLSPDTQDAVKAAFFGVSFHVRDTANQERVTLVLDNSRLCDPAAGWGVDIDGDGTCESWGLPPVLTSTVFVEAAENNVVVSAAETTVVLEGFFSPPRLSMALATDLCPDDPDKAAPGICGCGVADIDTDGDNVLDCNDACPDDPEKINAGACGCGVADIDENENGIADCVEAIVSPGPETVNVNPPASLEIMPFPGGAGNGTGILWQIAGDVGFSDMIFTMTGPAASNTLTIPDLLLSGHVQYFWRATYLGGPQGSVSRTAAAWFTTGTADMLDGNGNGVPDDQEPGGSENLIQERLVDLESRDIKYIRTDTGEFQFGLLPDATDTIIEAVKWMAADESGTTVLPMPFPRGVLAFRIQTVTPGDEVGVTIYFGHRLASGQRWWKFTPAGGWAGYSEHADIAKDRMSVHLVLKDGGFGDADGVVNGIIVDPSGPAGNETGGNSGGCFIDQVTGSR